MQTQLTAAATAFLEARGLDTELAVRMGLRSERPAGGGAEVLSIPFLRNGTVINHKRRSIAGEKKFWQDVGAPTALWNEDCLRDDSLLDQSVIITEGEMDALAAIQSGHFRAVSVPDGAPPPANRDAATLAAMAKYAWLEPVKGLLTKERAPVIIIASDGDENGGALLQDLSIQFGRSRCKFIVYPLAREPEKRGRPRLKDLNEVLEDYGQDGVRKTIAKAAWVKLDGIYRMSEMPEPPPTPVWDLGEDEFRLLGENMRLRPGDMSVGTGIPNYGKSTFANALWCHLAERHDLRITWVSMEQQTKPDHRRALRNWFLATSDAVSADLLRRADEWIEDHHVFVQVPEDQDATLDRVLDLGEAAAVRYGSQVMVIDPWNELEHPRDRHISLTEYVSQSLREVRRFARAFRMHVQILAHPTKAVQGENGNYRRPRMYDISDSAAWYNKADLGFVVHRPNEEETQIVVEKSRYHEVTGVPGEVFAHFSRSARRYKEIGRSSIFREEQ